MVIYRTFSFIQIILFFLLKVGYISGAAIALYHYNDNPVITIIVATVCLVFFVLTGTDEIIVNTDAIEYRSNSILRIFRERKEFKINDIQSFKVQGTYSTASELTSIREARNGNFNKMEIVLKNGEIISITTSIYIDKLKKVEQELKKLISPHR